MHGAQRVAYDEVMGFYNEQQANFAEIPKVEVLPLLALLASAHPFRGNVVPAAKAAIAGLRGRIAEVLNAARAEALRTLDDHEARIRASGEFEAIDEPLREQVFMATAQARSAIQEERFVASVHKRVQRYCADDYPAQLALAARLAMPAPKAARLPSGGTAAVRTPPPPVKFTLSTNLRPKCKLTYIATKADLDEWLEALREAAQTELDQGHRITL